MKRCDITLLFNRRKDDSEDFTDILLSKEELIKHAKEIARKHTVYNKTKLNRMLITRLGDNFNRIALIHKELNERINKKHELSIASEWLLDNFYKIEEQIKEVKKELGKERFLKLDIINRGFWKEYPRIFVTMLELVSHTDANFDEETLVEFIKEYQLMRILSISEIWAISLVIRVAIIDFIRLISEKAYRIEKDRDLVDQIFSKGNHEVINILKKTSKEKINSSFIEYFLKKLRKEDIDSGEILAYIEKNNYKYNIPIKKIIEEEHKEQTGLKISIGNAIVSLNEVSTIDWNDIFESLSVVEEVLRKDPAGIYSKMDFESRDYYRKQVEIIAKKCRLEEISVARKIVECAKSNKTENYTEKSNHVGYFLIDKGRKELFLSLGINAKFDYAGNKKLSFYLVPVLVITTMITVTLNYYLNIFRELDLFSYAFVLLLIISASADIAIVLTNRLMTSIFPPMLMPRLEYSEGIPKEFSTLVVIPALIRDAKNAEKLVKSLEVYYLVNEEENIYFAIAGDFKDAKECELAENKKITEVVLKEIKRLNDVYRCEKNIFYYFHRKRQYVEKQKKWTGWERKRGALTELNYLILGSKNTSYSVVSSDFKFERYKIYYND
ncbi:MAG: hypothetical protein LR001_08385 [Clostridiales bacterium]|nr:hypothetical protein [Clostridiales bacterium]